MILWHYFEFGDFRFDPEKIRLWRKDQVVHLAPKPLEILRVLVTNSGRTVTRDELLDAVWKDTFIEESNINFNVSLLRKVFREYGEKDCEFIKTVPKEGYRFVADVREIITEDAAGATLETEVVPEGSLQSAVLRLKDSGEIFRTHARWRMIAIALSGVFLATSFAFWTGLGRNAADAAPPMTSVAVLPLRSLSFSEGDRSLAVGFSDALETSLGAVRDTRVVAAAVQGPGDRYREPAEIGKIYGVDCVLDGSMQRVNGKIRVTLRLIRTADGSQAWSGSFDESESEIFHLQDTIAIETARALDPKFTVSSGENAKRQTHNIDAYSLYLKGEYLFRLRGDASRRSIDFFREAVALDPNYAQAWAGLASSMSFGVDIDMAESYATRALELDPDLSQAHATLGFISMFHHWNWADAKTSLDRAIELDPNSVEAHHWMGVLHSFHGHLDEAKSEMHRALDLDPLSLILLTDIGHLHYLAREYDQAEQYCLKALAIDPDYQMAHFVLRSVYLKQGRKDEAFAKNVLNECGTGAVDPASSAKCAERLKKLYLLGGWAAYLKDDIRRILRNRPDARAQAFPANVYYRLAWNYEMLDDPVRSVEYMELAMRARGKYDATDFVFPYLNVDPQHDRLRENPAFGQIIKEIDL